MSNLARNRKDQEEHPVTKTPYENGSPAGLVEDRPVATLGLGPFGHDVASNISALSASLRPQVGRHWKPSAALLQTRPSANPEQQNEQQPLLQQNTPALSQGDSQADVMLPFTPVQGKAMPLSSAAEEPSAGATPQKRSRRDSNLRLGGQSPLSKRHRKSSSKVPVAHETSKKTGTHLTAKDPLSSGSIRLGNVSEPGNLNNSNNTASSQLRSQIPKGRPAVIPEIKWTHPMHIPNPENRCKCDWDKAGFTSLLSQAKKDFVRQWEANSKDRDEIAKCPPILAECIRRGRFIGLTAEWPPAPSSQAHKELNSSEGQIDGQAASHPDQTTGRTRTAIDSARMAVRQYENRQHKLHQEFASILQRLEKEASDPVMHYSFSRQVGYRSNASDRIGQKGANAGSHAQKDASKALPASNESSAPMRDIGASSYASAVDGQIWDSLAQTSKSMFANQHLLQEICHRVYDLITTISSQLHQQD